MLAKGKFTGWHMTAILVAFFGTVIAVNFFMAKLAVGTFGGTVVDNSYVASQNYNGWLAAANQQSKLGWTVKASLTPERFVVIDATEQGRTLADIAAVGDAVHPLDRTRDFPLTFKRGSDGRLISAQRLPDMRWNVHISLRRAADIYNLTEQLR